MSKQVFIYEQLDQLNLCLTFYPAKTTIPAKATILYLHGGGLLYGNRDDLPEEYRTLFLENGYHLLTIDYPLAPEVKLPTIYHSIKKAIDWFLAHSQGTLALETSAYFLFGRSAGAYLAYLLSARHPYIHQKGLISFYGYYTLGLPQFGYPSPYYNQFPKVTPLATTTLIHSLPLTKASITERFPLYLSGRQFGNWLSYCLKSINDKEAFSLTDLELQQLPPTFLTHSSADQDIPASSSRDAASRIPLATYQEVANLPHDFDRDGTTLEAFQVYQTLITWLDKQTTL